MAQHARRTGYVCLRRRLPRRHDRLRLGRRDRPLPRRLRAAAVRLPSGRARRRRGSSSACSPSTAERSRRVIVEPLVQGAAGIRVQPPGFLRRVRELATEHDVLLIADEVATGFGRTGTMFACEQERVAPGLPLPRQGPDRRLSAARGDPDHRAGLRGLPRRPRGATAPSFTATPTPATRSPARRRSRASTCSRARRRCFACSRRSACSASCSPESRRCPRWPRFAVAGFMVGIDLGEHEPVAAARPPGGARGPRRGSDRAPARRHRRADAAAGDLEGRTSRRLVEAVADSIRALPAPASVEPSRRLRASLCAPPRTAPIIGCDGSAVRGVVRV